MCIGGPPKPKPLPPPRPTAPMPEQTAKTVAAPSKKKKTATGLQSQRSMGGTSSLQIKRLDTGTGPNLNIR